MRKAASPRSTAKLFLLMEGLSYREIAELMETSVSAVESRLFRARRVLRKKLAAVLKLDSPES